MSKPINELLKNEKVKRSIVFASLGVLFAASMYLIFAPSGSDAEKEEAGTGINSTIPQAVEHHLTDDKLKVYEFNAEEKEQERGKAIGSLAGLHETDIELQKSLGEPPAEEYAADNHIDRSVQQYRETSEALVSFYDSGHDAEKEEMQAEIERLNDRIHEMENNRNGEDDQLALLEKSYQMAAKYLPINHSGSAASAHEQQKGESHKEEPAFEVLPDRKPIVSSLHDVPFAAEYSEERNTGFLSASSASDAGPKNTISCKADRTVTIRDNETIRLRLTESVRIGGVLLPENSLLTARSRLSGNRMKLLVTSIEVDEHLFPVKLSAYDMDGLEGVFIPGSEEGDALKELGADVGGSIGTSFTFSSSAKDQIISDAARGLMQGASNYITKKIRTVKVTIKGGHRLMLLPAR